MISVYISGFYVLQLQDYCVKAVQVLMIQNNVLSNHPNSNVYRSGHVFLFNKIDINSKFVGNSLHESHSHHFFCWFCSVLVILEYKRSMYDSIYL